MNPLMERFSRMYPRAAIQVERLRPVPAIARITVTDRLLR